MPFTVLDLVVIGVVLISALLAAVRGFTREVLAIVAWVAAAAAAWFLHPPSCPTSSSTSTTTRRARRRDRRRSSSSTLIVVSIITVKISDLILDSRIGALDRTLGFLFGAARGFLICVIGWVFLAWLVPGQAAGMGARTPRPGRCSRAPATALDRHAARRSRGPAQAAAASRGREPASAPSRPSPIRSARRRRPPSAPPAKRSHAANPLSTARDWQPRPDAARYIAVGVRPARRAARIDDDGSIDRDLAGRRPRTDDLDLDGDKLREECGVFGIFGHPDAAALTALGLHALQHRGQEAAGIVSFDGQRFHSERHLGLVGDTFSDARPSSSACRAAAPSATSATRPPAGPILRNVQPLFAELDGGGFAVAHNGNLTNGLTLRARAASRDGAIFQSTSDTEVILHLIARSRKTRFVDRFIDALRADRGRLLAGGAHQQEADRRARPARHPPAGARRARRRATILASETCALDIIGARFVRDVENGEMVVIADDGHRSRCRRSPPQPARPCIFEYVYFARPDSRRERPLASTTCASAWARELARESAGRRRRRRAGAGFRRAGGARLRPGSAASPSSSASSATTMSAAPSSSRRSRSASSACAEALAPTAR